MALLERLRQQQKDLDEECDMLNGKLKRFRKRRSYETDEAEKIKLESLIEECEEDIERIEKKIEDLDGKIKKCNQGADSQLEQPPDFGSLYKPLLKLGYWEQQELFEKITKTKKYSHVAFLIRGSSKEYGQRWLLNRLVRQISKSLEGKKIVIDLNRTASRTNMPGIWNDFADLVGLPEETSKSQIVEMIYKLWQSQNVFIIFNNADESIKENVGELISDFWLELLQRMSDYRNKESPFKLFLFFLDYQGLVINWNIGFADIFGLDWQPNIPIALPAILPFSQEELKYWLNQQGDDLENLSEEIVADKERTLQVLLEKKGVPIPTFKKICYLCGFIWSDQENQWQRI